VQSLKFIFNTLLPCKKFDSLIEGKGSMSGEEVSRELKDNDILRLTYLGARGRRIM
jgi:hypothetical protein